MNDAQQDIDNLLNKLADTNPLGIHLSAYETRVVHAYITAVAMMLHDYST